MVEIEYIQPDVFVWRKGTDSVRSWDCPCAISQVDKEKERFKLVSLDDFKKSDWLPLHDEPREGGKTSIRRELRPCTQHEAQSYLIGVEERLEEAVKEARRKADDFKTNSDRYFLKCQLEVL